MADVKVMRLPQSKLVNMFITLGCTTAPDWNTEQLQERFDALPTMFAADYAVGHSGYQKLFDTLRTCISEGTYNGEQVTVKIVDDSASPVEPLIGTQARRRVVEQAAKRAQAAPKGKGKKQPPQSKKAAARNDRAAAAEQRKAAREARKEARQAEREVRRTKHKEAVEARKAERRAAVEARKAERLARRMNKNSKIKVRFGTNELATKIMKVLSFVTVEPRTLDEIATHCEMNGGTTEDVLKYLTIFKGVAPVDGTYTTADQCNTLLTNTLAFLTQEDDE